MIIAMAAIGYLRPGPGPAVSIVADRRNGAVKIIVDGQHTV